MPIRPDKLRQSPGLCPKAPVRHRPVQGSALVLCLFPKTVIRRTMARITNNHGVIARAYAPSDQDACLALFDGNVPAFFSPSERADFERFLTRQPMNPPYQLLVRADRVVGCGGLIVEKDRMTACLCWGMVDRGLQRTGLGRILTELRLGLAAAIPGIVQVRLDTSQHTQGFYALFGFQVLSITQSGYGPDLDRWDMVLRLDGIQR